MILVKKKLQNLIKQIIMQMKECCFYSFYFVLWFFVITDFIKKSKK